MSAKSTSKPQENATSGEAPLIIQAQYVKDVSFENPNPLEQAQASQAQPEINVNINVDATPLEGRTYEVSLHISAKAERAKKTMFMAEIEYAGVFTLGDMIEEANIGPVLMIECPRLLFPFARAVLADLTREGGYPPLALHPIDFVELYRRQHTQAQAAKQPAASH